jgi:hypothetical protein
MNKVILARKEKGYFSDDPHPFLPKLPLHLIILSHSFRKWLLRDTLLRRENSQVSTFHIELKENSTALRNDIQY